MRFLRHLGFVWLSVLVGYLADPAAVHASDYLSVKTYGGAVGDGSTDDTTAIQNTCNAARSAGVACYFPGGTYKITSAITFSSGSNMVKGDGAASIIYVTSNITMFKLDTGSDNYYNVFTGLKFVANISGTRTSNIGIEIGSTNNNSYANYNVFDNLRFSGTYYGIKVTKPSGGTGSTDWNRFTGYRRTTMEATTPSMPSSLTMVSAQAMCSRT